MPIKILPAAVLLLVSRPSHFILNVRQSIRFKKINLMPKSIVEDDFPEHRFAKILYRNIKSVVIVVHLLY